MKILRVFVRLLSNLVVYVLNFVQFIGEKQCAY